MSTHLAEWYTDIYSTVYGIDDSYSTIILKFNGYLKMLVNNSTFTAFSSIVISIGLALMLLHFFSDLSEKSAMKQITTLQLAKSILAAVLTVFVIFHTKQMFILMLTAVESLNDSMTVTANGYNITKFLKSDVVQTLMSRSISNNFDIMSILAYTLSGLLLEIVMLVTKIYITYYSATRIVQLFVYYLFMPIGISDVFENGPGGVFNLHSPGIKYLKTMLAIMLQVVVITIVCQSYPLITRATNYGYYYEDNKSSSSAGSIIGNLLDFLPDSAKDLAITVSVNYPLLKMEYTDNTRTLWDKVKSGDVLGMSNIAKKIVELGEATYTAAGGDIEDIVDGDTESSPSDYAKEGNTYKLSDVIDLSGTIKDEKKEKEILEDSKYKMTVESVEKFFSLCIGSDGRKMVMLIILMIVKIFMVGTSAKICSYITGISI